MELFLYGKSYCLFQRYDGFHPYIAGVPYNISTRACTGTSTWVLVHEYEYKLRVLWLWNSRVRVQYEYQKFSTRVLWVRVLSTSTPALVTWWHHIMICHSRGLDISITFYLPSSQNLTFFETNYIEFRRKLCLSPFAWLTVLHCLGYRAVGYVEPC